MARKNAKNRNVRREAIGILMQALWVLLLLALASYDARDTADWSPAGEGTLNYIGPVGAWTAFVLFRTFGLVAMLTPLMLAVWGLLMWFRSGERLWPRVLWMLGVLTGLCVLVDIQLPFWNEMAPTRLNVGNMPGGFLGLFLGRQFLEYFLGRVGAAILCTGAVVTGLFFVAQTHPKELWNGLKEMWAAWQERREERLAGRRSAEEQAEREAIRLERERLKLERELAKERAAQEREALKAQREQERADRAAQREREAAEREERRAQKEREAAEAAERERQEMERQEAEEAARKEEFRRQAEERRRADADRKAKEEAEAKRMREEVAHAEAAAANAPAPQWNLPPMTLLQAIPEGASVRAGAEELEATMQVIKRTLAEFGIEAEVTHVEQGPTVTRYELLPAAGVKVERIGNLAGNLTLALKAESVRVQAPIPGKGVVGIEVPNRQPAPVVLRQLLESAAWASTRAMLPLALGQDVSGHVLMADLATLPHLLIAGATGMGKTVCMNSLLAGLLMTRTPDELRLILVDPKIVEFSDYNGLPHLLTPVITEAKNVIKGLQWAIKEMERRFQLFHRARVRDIKSFNTRPKAEQKELFEAGVGAGVAGAAEEVSTTEGEEESAEALAAAEAAAARARAAAAAQTASAEEALPDRLPYVVIIIDELADLMLMEQKDIEPRIQKLTQLARATGIHMIIATQRPTVDIITGTIKSNVPGRVAFKVAQKNDSRVVIDREGADKLVGRGDMLVLSGTNKLVRAQGAWTKDEEIRGIAQYWKDQGAPSFEKNLQARMEGKGGGGDGGGFGGSGDEDNEDEELLQQALEVIRQTRRASTSSIQRRLRIGYTRAARVMDLLEEKGMIGPTRGAEPREILFDLDGDGEDDGGEGRA